MSITVKRSEGYVDFCEDLSLRSEWEAAVDELDAIRKQPGSRRLADTTELDAARKVEEIEQAMGASVVRVKIRSLGRKRWQELGAAHPPRDGDEQDQALGVNRSTFFDAVAKESIFAAVEKVSGDVRDFDPKADWDDLADEMSDGQYSEFATKFLELNRGVTGVPFSRVASQLTKGSDEISS